jgi:hypothetical protein
MSQDQTTVRAVCALPKVAYRIEAGGRPIAMALAMALAMADGTWMLHDMEERRLSPIHYRTPQMVATAAKRLGMHT